MDLYHLIVNVDHDEDVFLIRRTFGIFKIRVDAHRYQANITVLTPKWKNGVSRMKNCIY